MSKLRSGLSYANVIATLALFLALGGGAYAAFQLPKNSVGAKQLTSDAVNSSKVKNRSLLAKDFAFGQLPRGAQGERGPQGLTGATGQTGSAGRDGAAIAVRVRSTGGADTPADHSSVSIPLASDSWNQAAGEVDFGPFGRVTYTAPDASSCGGTGLADLSVEVDVDGKFFSTITVQTLRDGGTRSATFDASRYLFESGNALSHVVTAKVSSGCESGSLAAPFTVSDLRFDLIRAS